MTNLLAAEWLKLRTTRTTWALLATTVALSGLAVASTVLVVAGTSVDLEATEGGRDILSVSVVGAMFVLILGIIMSAGEYRHGTAVDTFLSTPQRWKVITAKLVTATATGALFGAVASAAAVGAAMLTYGFKGLTFPLGWADLWPTSGAAVLYAALFGSIGAATGSLVRNQVVAIVGWLSWIAMVEHVAEGFAPSIGRWLPVGAGRALVGGTNLTDPLSSQVAAAALAGYAVAIAVAAIWSERFRDA